MSRAEVPHCDTCGRALGQVIGDRIICSSQYIEGPTCRSCQLEYCLATNCLGCKKGIYPHCRHLPMKRFYQQENQNGETAGDGAGIENEIHSSTAADNEI